MYLFGDTHRTLVLKLKADVKRKCKTRIEVVGAGSPRPWHIPIYRGSPVTVGEPNPYEDSVAVARFLNVNQVKLLYTYRPAGAWKEDVSPQAINMSPLWG